MINFKFQRYNVDNYLSVSKKPKSKKKNNNTAKAGNNGENEHGFLYERQTQLLTVRFFK